MLPNILQYPVAIVGAFRAGLTVVNTNPLYTPRELEHQLRDSGARAIVILENFAHTLQQVHHETAVETVIVTGIGDLLGFPKGALANFVLRHVKKQVPEYSLPGAIGFNEALGKGKFENLDPVPLGHEDIAFLQYTGGTTGVSKGAVLTHRNMVANVLQSEAWMGPSLREASGQMILVTALPLYHIFSLTANCLLFMRLGAHNVLIANPRDFPGFVKELSKYRFTFFSGVNTLFNALLHTPGFDQVDFSALKVSLGGGMAVQRAVAERWKQVTGGTLTQAWGLTETSPAACINRFDAPEFNGSIGLPISSTDDHDPRRRRQRAADAPVGRDLRRGPAGDARLLEPSGRDREGDARRPRAAHRRHRLHGRGRLRVHRGSQEGHDPRVGLQRVSERGRGRGRRRIRACSRWRRSRSPTSAPARSWRCSS